MNLDTMLTSTFEAERDEVNNRRLALGAPSSQPLEVAAEPTRGGWRALPLARAAIAVFLVGFVSLAAFTLLQRSTPTSVLVAAPDQADTDAGTNGSPALFSPCADVSNGIGAPVYQAETGATAPLPPPTIKHVGTQGSLLTDGCIVITIEVGALFIAADDASGATPVDPIQSAVISGVLGDLELRLNDGILGDVELKEPDRGTANAGPDEAFRELHLEDGSIVIAANDAGQRVLRFIFPPVASSVAVDGTTIVVTLVADDRADESAQRAEPGEFVPVFRGRPLRNAADTLILTGEITAAGVIEPGAMVQVTGWAKGGLGPAVWHMHGVLTPAKIAEGTFSGRSAGDEWQRFETTIDTSELAAGDYTLELGSSDPSLPWRDRCVTQWVRLGESAAPRVANSSLSCIGERSTLAIPTPTVQVGLPQPAEPLVATAADVRLCVTGIVAPDTLNLRDGPNTTFDVIAEMPQSSCALFDTGVPAQDGWRRLRFESAEGPRIGWASGRYLSVALATPAELDDNSSSDSTSTTDLVEQSVTVRLHTFDRDDVAAVEPPPIDTFDVFVNSQRVEPTDADGALTIVRRPDADLTRVDLAVQEPDGCWWVGTGLIGSGSPVAPITVERNCSCIADTAPPICLVLD